MFVNRIERHLNTTAYGSEAQFIESLAEQNPQPSAQQHATDIEIAFDTGRSVERLECKEQLAAAEHRAQQAREDGFALGVMVSVVGGILLLIGVAVWRTL